MVPVFLVPVNGVAAMIVAPFGIRSEGRPGMLGNLFVGLVAIVVGIPSFIVACVSLSFASAGFEGFVCGYLFSFALLASALAFAIHSRMSQLASDVDEE